MDKENFINTFKHIDADYIPEDMDKIMRPYIEEKMKENNTQSIKDYCIKENATIFLSNVNMRTINELCTYTENIENNMINPFETFYKLGDDAIKSLFYILAKTHTAIEYYEKYSMNTRELKSKNTHGNISRKINDVIEYIHHTDMDMVERLDKIGNNNEKPDELKTSEGFQTIQYLKGLVQTLDNSHYTLRQVFHNLLYEIYYLLIQNNISKSKIITIVNSLIKNYFTQDIEFTNSTKPENFTTINYVYGTMAGIDLTHGKK